MNVILTTSRKVWQKRGDSLFEAPGECVKLAAIASPIINCQNCLALPTNGEETKARQTSRTA